MNIRDKLSTYISSEIYGQIKEISAIANKKQIPICLVGGVIRDVLLQRRVVDADIMMEPPVKPVMDELAKKKSAQITTHDRFLTYSVQFSPGVKMDVVTAREETYSQPGQLPLVKASTIQKDLRRRDFTINAMACWLTSDKEGDLLDPFFGREDLQEKIIRALHAQSFVDDPTRIYRAARFAGRLGFQVAKETEKWIKGSMERKIPHVLSPVRRRHEFDLILKEGNPAACLSLLQRWGALACVHHNWGDVPDHLLENMGHTPPGKSPVSLLVWRYAIWFRPWGAEAALQMMTELAFEKEMKKNILSLL